MNPMMEKHLALLFAKRSGVRDGADFPALTAAGAGSWPAEKLASYRRICGLPPGDGALPLLVPQIQAAKLHLDLFADRAFPFAPLGIVHVENRVELTGPLPSDSPLDLAVSVGNCRPSKRGWLFDLVTEATGRNHERGRFVATILAPVKGGLDAPKVTQAAEEAPEGPPRSSSILPVPEDIGRRYGAIASDRNPIHQHALLAKPFGFPRAIAHGLWTLARALGEVSASEVRGPVTCVARFRRPIFLPSRVLCEARERAGGGLAVEVRSLRGEVHLAVTLT